MSDSYADKSESTDDETADSHLAELERAAERSREQVQAIVPTCIGKEHIRYFASKTQMSLLAR